MVRLGPFKAAAGHQQDIGGMEQIPGKLLVAGDVEFLHIQLGEYIKSRFVFHHGKTADLLQAPVEMGLTLAGCEPRWVEKGHEYGYHMGIAFQIMDDILDVEGDPALMGKNTGMDERKLTWVALRGVGGAREDMVRHINEAVEALNAMPFDTSFLRKLTMDTINRLK